MCVCGGGGGGGGLYPGGLISGIKRDVSERRDKTYLRKELKLTYHYVLSYIYNTFIVRYNKRRFYFKNIYKTDLCDCLKRNANRTHLHSRWASIRGGLKSGILWYVLRFGAFSNLMYILIKKSCLQRGSVSLTDKSNSFWMKLKSSIKVVIQQYVFNFLLHRNLKSILLDFMISSADLANKVTLCQQFIVDLKIR